MGDADPTALVADLRARLTGPGGDFELATENVCGIDLPVFARRRPALRDWLLESANYGDREYLVQGDRRLSFAEHLAAVASLADVLAADYGVEPGDRVAILASNSPDWVIAFWAAVSLGAVAVAGNAWWTAREAQYSLHRTRPRVVVADGKRAELLDGLDLPVLRIADLPRLVVARGPIELREVVPDQDSPAVVMFTSGTTGHPKGAVHSHRNLLAVIEYHRYTDAMAAQLASAFGQPTRTTPRRYLMSLPLFHIASLHNLALPRLTSGDTVVIDDGRFDADRVLRLIERETITNWAIVPTMAHRIVEQGSLNGYDLSSLAALSINSAPSSPALKDRLRATIPTVQAALADSYGLTEASTAATVATPMDLALQPTTVGGPIPGVEMSVRSSDGDPLADGQEGEIWLRSQFTMLGYWEDAEATAAALTPDGWLRTGDLGRVQDGRLFMASRRSDLILRGGENVYPAEVEAVLDEHPGVRECAVFGVDDADLGQAVAAVVVCTDVTEEQLRTFAAERLAYYKVPSQWRLTEAPLTRTATGKVVRRSLAVGD
ncbi:MAG: steroid-24-oyl-CoA synthetase [Pseudonocardiales bacterium]|jgi:acyl-CoA synthetase (AMP-forming)/AMP-acid ligase II|nr:steroid-24-oyl-CoA synthetase [Pseudonocardiales bacterium]